MRCGWHTLDVPSPLISVRVASFSFPAFLRDDRRTLLCEGAESTRVGLCSHVASSIGPVGSVSGKHIAVLFPLKLSKLIEVYEVVAFSLIVCAVFCVLHRAKIDLGARRESPHMFTLVELSTGKRSWVYLCGSVHELRQLWISLTQYQPSIVWNVYLP